MASSRQRERELARARFERQQAKRAERARRRRATNRAVVAGIAVVAIVALIALTLVRSDDDETDPAATGETSPSASATDDAAAPANCAAVPATTPATLSWPSPPEQTINPDAAYTISLNTNCGPITIAADAKNAPVTTNSMVFLANQMFFDNTPCHRLTTEGIFVLQCGDPTGTGTGGPGYQIPDENLPTAEGVNYPAGTVAMANSGPNTNGSQFFLVYDDTTLGPNYTVLGQITEGLDIVKGIAAGGVQGGTTDGPPATPVTILTATTSETLPTG
ncbi:MAG: peptidylprolyl isomerase [Candidatus Nanopelagicales bacterium]